MEKSIKLDRITMGVCYYPEHWDESLWEDDLRRMLAHGLRVVRIAEFAWNKFEPEEGQFTFEFFDRFLQLAQKTGMRVIFCTPTATPPAWAAHRYPEILNARKDGVLLRHGLRRHYNYNSSKYRALTREIVERLAAHYGSHPSIVGWQIDNEINCGVNEFYSESDHAAFRAFLLRKYKTLDALNEAWGTVFWNQTYTGWDQVFAPREMPGEEGNPHQRLDYIRFISDSACEYVKLQADILRRYLPEDVYITTNGIFGNVDNHRQTQENLDFMMYDSYPNFAYALGEDPRHSTSLNDRKWSRHLSAVRSISPNFGIMEQQSGPGGWTFRMEAPAPKPGQLTLWTLQSVAHGADYVSYFRWRTCTVGTEIYWHGILDYDNLPNRRLEEVGQVAKKLDAIGALAGSRYKAAFALLRDYDNEWDAQYDAWHRRVQTQSENGWFNAAQLTHTPMDYVYLTPDTTVQTLSEYPLLVYPHATILTPRTAALLKDYVAQGGTLLVGCRTGYKDENGHCVMLPKPGLLAELCGAQVADCTFVGPNDDPCAAIWGGKKLDAPVFHDILRPVGDGKVEAVYDGDYYRGEPALISNRCGKGTAYYFGAAFSAETAAAFLQAFRIASPFADVIGLPPECELAVREKDGVSYLFVLNFAHHACNVTLRRPMTDLYDGRTKEGEFTLEKYETRVFQIG